MTATSPLVLVGDWRFTRQIDDRHAGRHLHVNGTLSIAVESPGVLSWQETGELNDGERTVPVWRRHTLEQQDEGWMVLFEDGRPFHPWSPDATVDHLCGADTYRGTFGLDDLPDTWSVRWECRGPTKDYTIDTAVHR